MVVVAVVAVVDDDEEKEDQHDEKRDEVKNSLSLLLWSLPSQKEGVWCCSTKQRSSLVARLSSADSASEKTERWSS
jgi:hypothetical protein